MIPDWDGTHAHDHDHEYDHDHKDHPNVSKDSRISAGGERKGYNQNQNEHKSLLVFLEFAKDY